MIDTKQTTPKHQPTMNEKTETPEALAAILAEMRHRAENHRLDGWESVAEELDDLCDRIDAAAERERNAHANDIHNALYMAAGTPGNAAAMRAALVEVEGAIFEDDPGRFWLADAEVILHRVKTALSAPARNCDVGTSEEQAERFKQFCLDNHSAEHLCSRCPLGKQLGNDVDMCQLHWAQMPYAPAEGGDHA